MTPQNPVKPIVTLTMNPAIDLATHVPELTPDRKIRCSEPAWYPGGGGINVARMLNQLGQDVLAIYPYGGYLGSRLKRLLRQEGIPQVPVPIRGKTRESLLVSEDNHNHSYRFIMPGPSLSKLEMESCLKAVEDAISNAQMLVISGSLPGNVDSEYYGQIVRLARKQRLPVLVDASPQTLPEALAEGFFLLRLNQQEFEQLIGKRNLPLQQLFGEVRQFLEKHPLEGLVVTLAHGAMLATKYEIWEASAPSVKKVGPSGAGDCFVAGFVYQWLLRKPLPDILRFSVASAAAAMMTPGGELAHPEDIQRLLKETEAKEISTELLATH